MEFIDKYLGIDIRKGGLLHQHIHGIDMLAPSGKTLVVPEGPGPYYSMVSPRYHFDHLLHQHAVRSGARFEVMDVDGPLYSQDGRQVVGIVQRNGKTLVEHEARVVIAADGVSSAVARSVRGRVADPHETALAIRAYGRLKRPLQRDPVVYFKYLLELVPGYAWVFPTAPDQVNVGVGLFDQVIYKRRGKTLKQLLNEFVASMERDLPIEIDTSTLKSWPIPIWVTRESRVVKGVYLVGDAGRFVDALTGGGIYPAMITGQLAAQAAIRQLAGMPATEAAAYYDAQWQGSIGRSLSRLLLVQRWVGSKPRVFNAIFALANAVPPLRFRLLNGLAGQHA